MLIYFFVTSNPMFPLLLGLPEKYPRPKWTIYKNELDYNKKTLSVDNLGI